MVTDQELKEMLEEYHSRLSPFQERLIELLEENGPMTRNQICEALGFEKHVIGYTISYPDKRFFKRRYTRGVLQYDQRTTVYDNLVKLEKKHLVEEFRDSSHGKRGRPKEYWRVFS